MTPIPASFAPVEGADGAALTVRGVRDATRVESLVVGLQLAAITAVVMFFVGLMPSEDGDTGPTWAVLTGSTDPVHLVLFAILIGGSALVAFGLGFTAERKRKLPDETAVHLGRFALTVGEDAIPWHELESAGVADEDIWLARRSGGTVRIQARHHKKKARGALVARMREHIDAAAVDDAARKALHDAARTLGGREPA